MCVVSACLWLSACVNMLSSVPACVSMHACDVDMDACEWGGCVVV